MVGEMKTMLWRDFKIRLVLQPPNSPESNTLDLGIWRSIQARVDLNGVGARLDLDVLVANVQKAWDEYEQHAEGDLAMAKVWAKLQDIAELAVANDGKNCASEGKGMGAAARALMDWAEEEVEA